MVPPTQFPRGSCASNRSSPATANSFLGAFASSARKSATLISLPLRSIMGRPSFRTKGFAPQKNEDRPATRCGSSAVVGPSWRHRRRRRGGGEDPWLCAPGFRRVCLSRCGVLAGIEIRGRHRGVKALAGSILVVTHRTALVVGRYIIVPQ